VSVGCCAGIAGAIGTAGIYPSMSNSTRKTTVCQYFVLAWNWLVCVSTYIQTDRPTEVKITYDFTSAISNADEQMQALSASISVSRY